MSACRAYQQILALLAERGVPYELIEHPPLRTLGEIEQQRPDLMMRMLKTIAFRIQENGYVLAAVPGTRRIHYKLLADHLGINRRRLRALAPAEVEAELGFLVGGVAPFRLQPDVTVVVDATVSDWKRANTGSGVPTATLQIAPQHIIALANAAIAPIVRS